MAFSIHYIRIKTVILKVATIAIITSLSEWGKNTQTV